MGKKKGSIGKKGIIGEIKGSIGEGSIFQLLFGPSCPRRTNFRARAGPSCPCRTKKWFLWQYKF